jgi:phage-related protein
VRGIWRGVSSMFGWLWDQVTGFVSGIIDGVKGALGMHSPSKVFADIGKNMALGLGEGFTRSFDRVGNEVVGAVGQMVPALAPTTAMGDMGGGGTTVILYADRYMGSAQEARYYSDMIARQIKFGG